MKILLMLIGLVMVAGTAYASPINVGVAKGRNRNDFNMTISSFATTPIVSAANANDCYDWDIVNNGSYSIYIATYSVVDTSGTTCREIKASASYSPNGANGAPVYGFTAAGTAYTSKIDGSLYK